MLTGVPNNLYIFVFFCHTENVYIIVANTENKLKNPLYVNMADTIDIVNNAINIITSSILFFSLIPFFFSYIKNIKFFYNLTLKFHKSSILFY